MLSDMTDRMVGKIRGKVDKINGMVDKMTQIINSHSESIVKIETYEKEPSPIYWLPQQYQAEPPPQKNFNVAESIAKIEAHLEKATTPIERTESFKVSRWLILMNTTWWMRVLLVISKLSPH
jgi:formyltetrahydrofolate hydrolase